MSFERGLVVKSLCGRDAGRLLAVVGVNENAVEVCDGRERKLQKPKIKNSKHVEATEYRVSEKELSYNGRLRKALNRLTDDLASL